MFPKSYDSFDQLLRRLSLVVKMTQDSIDEMKFFDNPFGDGYFTSAGVSYLNPYSSKARSATMTSGANLLREMLGSNAPIILAGQEEITQEEIKNPFDKGSNDDDYGDNEF